MGTKINCRSEKEIFNPEIRQQWQQNRQDTSAEEFAKTWNFLCDLQGPAKSKSGTDDIHGVDQDLDDIEDFVEDDTDIEDHSFEVLGREKYLRRKQISLCRHKLQGRAYPKIQKTKTTLKKPEQLLKTDDLELDHEWLQLIQMERMIQTQKNQLWKNEVEGHWNQDENRETFWEDEDSCANERDDHLDEGDLEYINAILNSLSKQNNTHKNSNHLQLKSLNPGAALTRALAPLETPPEFNLKFNQNLTSRGTEDNHFSYFPNVEEEEHTELGDYFSDDEEDDSVDEDFLTCGNNLWSHTDFNNTEENFTHSIKTLSEWDPVISGLETIGEARYEDDSDANKLNHISGLSEETKLAFSTWQPFIPHEHAFRNCAARSQLSDFSSQASSLQEPTLIQISTITTSTKLTQPPMKQTSPQMKTTLSPPKDWPSSKPATRPSMNTWTKPWTKSTKIYNGTQNWRTELLDHPGPLEQYRHWKRPLQCSKESNHNQNTRFQNTPPVTDAGGEPQVCTQWKSRNSSTMKSRTNITQI